MVASDTAISVFFRMIEMGRDAEESIQVIAFWMWLETHGFEEVIVKLSTHDDKFLALVTDEARAVLSSLNSYSSKTLISSNLMRVTTTLAPCFLSPSAILADKEKAMKGIAHVFGEACCVIFDILKERGIKVGKELDSIVKFWPGTCRAGETAEATAATLQSGESKLNPLAKEWNPKTEKVPEKDRCLFLTFSNGYPLSENQIINFFNEKFGQCVERVYVHWPDRKNRRKAPPLFGKVVFKAYYIPVVILGGKGEAKFWVDRKPLWCKRFDPEKKNTTTN